MPPDTRPPSLAPRSARLFRNAMAPPLPRSFDPRTLVAALRGRAPDLPGSSQRRRLAIAALLALPVVLLRPWPPLQWLPGWCVGGLLLWVVVEALLWQWRPRRWR